MGDGPANMQALKMKVLKNWTLLLGDYVDCISFEEKGAH